MQTTLLGRKEWRQHLKVLSEKHPSLQRLRGSVLQLPTGVGEYIHGNPACIRPYTMACWRTGIVLYPLMFPQVTSIVPRT